MTLCNTQLVGKNWLFLEDLLRDDKCMSPSMSLSEQIFLDKFGLYLKLRAKYNTTEKCSFNLCC